MTDPAIGARLNEEQLTEWGRLLGREAGHGAVFVALYGVLGAGKSTLARAACRGLGVEGAIPSPTFTLINVHRTATGAVHHADLYRIEADLEEEALEAVLVDAGWPGLLESDEPVFVEWADRAAGWLPADRWDVWLAFTSDAGTRDVSIVRRGNAPTPPEPPC